MAQTLVQLLLSPTTSITRAPPSKDVGQVRKHSPMPLKQHGHWCRLPLPSPSALPHHSTLSIENASPGLLLPSSATSLDAERRGCLPWSVTALAPSTLPRHPSSSVEDALGLPPPSSAMSLDIERRRHLPWSASALAPSALPCHPTSSIEDAPDLPLPSSVPHHLTSSIKNVSPRLLLPYQKPRNAL